MLVVAKVHELLGGRSDVTSHEECALLSAASRNHFLMTLVACLTWWPMHLPSSQQMHVKMIDGLSAVGAGVDHDSKTVVEVLQLCNFICCEKEFIEEFGFSGGRVSE